MTDLSPSEQRKLDLDLRVTDVIARLTMCNLTEIWVELNGSTAERETSESAVRLSLRRLRRDGYVTMPFKGLYKLTDRTRSRK